MAFPISTTALGSLSVHLNPARSGRSKSGSHKIPGSAFCLSRDRFTGLPMGKAISSMKTTKDAVGPAEASAVGDKLRTDETNIASDPFEELKNRFLDFKKHSFIKNIDHYRSLSERQEPKFLVIACADSRVCPSTILGFRTGEAFTVRNIANLVPPFQHEPSETSAALEFAVNSLQVENILVVGHSRCGGIRALMTMEENDGLISRSFIREWVSIAKGARLSTEAAVGHTSLDEQCTHCEKESINRSLLNLMTYPWIAERAGKGKLSINGGYYNFVNCVFEKWTLACSGGEDRGKYSFENHTSWA